jgi:hypothetical protein
MRLVVHTFAHPTIVAPAIGHQLRVAVCRPPFSALSPTYPPLGRDGDGAAQWRLPSVSEHDLENAALGHVMPLLRALGPPPEDHLRTIARKGILCVHAQSSAPHGRGRGCCRGRAQARSHSEARDAVCLGADKVRCCLGHKEMPDCWEATEAFGPVGVGGLDPLEIIRSWREGVYVTTVRG